MKQEKTRIVSVLKYALGDSSRCSEWQVIGVLFILLRNCYWELL